MSYFMHLNVLKYKYKYFKKSGDILMTTKDKTIRLYDEDRNYSLCVYGIFMVINFCLLFFSDKIAIYQAEFISIYKILTLLTLISLSLCFYALISKKVIMEGIVLNFALSFTSVLIMEKIIAYSITSEFHIADFILYIDITIIKLLFLIYRYLKIRNILKLSNLYSELLKHKGI